MVFRRQPTRASCSLRTHSFTNHFPFQSPLLVNPKELIFQIKTMAVPPLVVNQFCAAGSVRPKRCSGNGSPTTLPVTFPPNDTRAALFKLVLFSILTFSCAVGQSPPHAAAVLETRSFLACSLTFVIFLVLVLSVSGQMTCRKGSKSEQTKHHKVFLFLKSGGVKPVFGITSLTTFRDINHF